MTSPDAGTRVTIVGVGPGDNGFLTLKAKQAIEEADLVAGFQTVLNVVLPFAKKAEICAMAYRDQEEVLDYAVGKVKEGKSLVVCAWGDLNVSAKELLDRVRRRVDHVDLVPGSAPFKSLCLVPASHWKMPYLSPCTAGTVASRPWKS